MIRVVIADDHALLAESLQFMLQQDGGIEVAGLAANGNEAVELCRRFSPQVVLMDIRMLECDGLKAAETIKRLYPDTRIAMLTTFEEKADIREAIIKGADGYILKDVRPYELILAIKCINSGFSVMHGTVKKFIQEEFINHAQKEQKPDANRLKPEEIRIIRLISDGKNNREIAETLNYSEGAIKNKISRILENLKVNDRTQLVVYALKNELI